MEPLLVPIAPCKGHSGPTAADLLSVSRETVKRLIAAGEIESIHQGRRHLVVVESLREYVERRRLAGRSGGDAA